MAHLDVVQVHAAQADELGRRSSPLPVYSDIVSFDDAPTALAQRLRKPLVLRDGY